MLTFRLVRFLSSQAVFAFRVSIRLLPFTMMMLLGIRFRRGMRFRRRRFAQKAKQRGGGRSRRAGFVIGSGFRRRRGTSERVAAKMGVESGETGRRVGGAGAGISASAKSRIDGVEGRRGAERFASKRRRRTSAFEGVEISVKSVGGRRKSAGSGISFRRKRIVGDGRGSGSRTKRRRRLGGDPG